MLPEEWPIRPPAERGTVPLAFAASRDRLSTVRQDFLLPSAHRLTEQERALMTAMLHRLVEDISAEIQLQLPQDWLPANEDHAGLIDRLSQSGLLDIAGLIALLLRRADEERIQSSIRARPGHKTGSMIQSLVSGENADVAASAMAVLVARGRRRDRYGQAVVELDDVPVGDAADLVHAVAVALCERKPVHVPNSEAERELSKAANAILAGHDPARSLDEVTAELIRHVDEAGLLDDLWLRLAINSAEIGLMIHTLARRARVAPTVAAGELLSGDSRRIMLFLRVAAIPRDLAGHLVAVLGDLLGLGADLEPFAHYATLSSDRVEAAESSLGLDPRFKSALKRLGHGHSAF